MDTSELNFFVNEIGPELGMASTDIRLIAASILNALFGLIGILSVIFIIYGGFVWMTAGGNQELVKKAQRTLQAGLIGIIIVLSSYSLAKFALDAVLRTTGTIY